MSSYNEDFAAKPSSGGSPSRSVSSSASLDESKSSCDSFKSSLEFEYIDNDDILEVESIEKKTAYSLCVSDEKVVDIDHDNLMDPQFCATIAWDIYKHLLKYEANRMPFMDYMETTQKEINPKMRAILIDWLVLVSVELKLVPETLFLAVNYIDRYLSGNVMNIKRLQLLGVSCLMIAAKYEETNFDLQVEWFSSITDDTYVKEEVLQMESDVLNNLEFEMTAPTTMCFLRRFCFAAQQSSELPFNFFGLSSKVTSVQQLWFLASYIAELSLVEYDMLYYSPSLIAASAVFLAKYILSRSKKPWNSTLRHYTLYQDSDLCDCQRAASPLS